MLQFIIGAAAGAAGYWAYQRYVVGTDDDAFADFETSSLDRSAEIHPRPTESTTSTEASSTTPKVNS